MDLMIAAHARALDLAAAEVQDQAILVTRERVFRQ